MKSPVSDVDVLLLLRTLKAEPWMTLGRIAAIFGITRIEAEALVNSLMTIMLPPEVGHGGVRNLRLDFRPDPASGDVVVQLTGWDQFESPGALLAPEAHVLSTALEALERDSGRDEKHTIRRLRAKIEAAREPQEASPRDPRPVLNQRVGEWLVLLEQAISTHRVVRIAYYSAERSELTRRAVRPEFVSHAYGSVYLFGYCELRRDTRNFRLDRIQSLELLDRTFDPATTPPYPALDNAVPGWDGVAGDRWMVLRAAPPVAELLSEYALSRGGDSNPVREGPFTVEVRVPLYGAEWAMAYVLRFGPDVELVSPGWLRDKLLERIDRLLRDVA